MKIFNSCKSVIPQSWKEYYYKSVNSIWKTFFWFAPVANEKIIFNNFNGKGYGCNPKYIAEEILNQGLEFDLVWLVNDMSMELPAKIRKVQYGSAEAFYEMATAKVIVTNVKNDLNLFKKKKQYIIQTWHGSYSSKLLEREVEDKLSPEYIKASKKNSKQTDLFLSNSKAMTQCYKEAFWCESEVLECGFPRNDMLFTKDVKNTVAKVKKAFGISEVCKIILYAPTFRDDGSIDAYSLDCKKVVEQLKKSGEEWKLLVRLHPNVGAAEGLFEFGEDIINATSYSDMQELLLACEILITDYSSTIFEFASMRKQSYIYAPDIEEYQRIRGLKKDFFYMPYPINRTNEELLKNIEKYTPQGAARDAEEFVKLYGGVDKGDASKQVVLRICKVMKM